MGFLEVKNLKVHYPIRGGFFNTVQDYIKAVDGVDMDIEEGKTYGLIGESGSGKSTIGKAIVGLEKITDDRFCTKEKMLQADLIEKRLTTIKMFK